MTATATNKPIETKTSPVQNNNKSIPKTAQVVLGASNIEEKELNEIKAIQSSNLKETFKIKYSDIYYATSSEEVKQKDFDFEMLPAIDPVLTYTGGSGNLRGNPSIPEIKPGIPIRTVLKHKNINILGGKNVIQTIGVETKFINLVGAFLSTEKLSSYKLAEKFDHEVVQPGLEVSLELTTVTSSTNSAPTNIKLKGIITDFKVYAIRKDKTYYGISIICSDLEIVKKKPAEQPADTNTNQSTPSSTPPKEQPKGTTEGTNTNQPQPSASPPKEQPKGTTEGTNTNQPQPSSSPPKEQSKGTTEGTNTNQPPPASLTPPPKETDESLATKIDEIINANSSLTFSNLSEYNNSLTTFERENKKIENLANRIKDPTTKNKAFSAGVSMVYQLYIISDGKVISNSRLSQAGFTLKDIKNFYTKALNLNRKLRSFNFFDGEQQKENNKKEEQQILEYLRKLNAQ